MAQVGGEDGGLERGDGVVEEGLLLGWFDGVEFGEGEAEEPVGCRVLDEGGGDGGRELDGLAGYRYTADVDRVGADVACRAGTVAVGDGVGCAVHHFEGC